MNNINLDECPKFEGYWLLKTNNGKMAMIFHREDDGCLHGYVYGNACVWRPCGTAIMGYCSHSFDLVGPWKAEDIKMPQECSQHGMRIPKGQKAIVGWTAEEMANHILKQDSVKLHGGDVGYGNLKNLMQSLIDNKTKKPVYWCKHIRREVEELDEGGREYWLFGVNGAIKADIWNICPLCWTIRPPERESN